MSVVPGYLFIWVYRYVLYKDQNSHNQVSYLMFVSIVASYILKTTYDLFPFVSDSRPWYLAVFLCFSGIAGYLLAIAANLSFVNNLRKTLKIFRSPNDDIWDDALKPSMWIRVWLSESGKSYMGQMKYLENYEREPIVVLEHYVFLDDDGSELVDNSKDNTRTVMLNLRNFERIEMIDGSWISN